MLKIIIENWKENDNEVDVDVAQLERNNNKYYASAFRYIQIKVGNNGFKMTMLENLSSYKQKPTQTNAFYKTQHQTLHKNKKYVVYFDDNSSL